MSQKDGIVHLWDLPEDKVFIKPPNNIQRQMIKNGLNIAKSRKNLAKELDVNAETIYDFRACRFGSVKLSFVKKLVEFLQTHGINEFSLENLENKVELVRTKTSTKPMLNPKFPMDFNCPQGAQIIAGTFFDGGITAELMPFYTNNENELIDRFLRNLERVVGRVKFHKRIVHTTYQIEFSTTLGIILVYGLNLKAGKKILTDPEIPEFILNGSKEIQKAFLQQAFDDEGTVSLGNKGSGRAISLCQCGNSQKSPIRLLQLKELIENFGIIVNGPYFTREWYAKNGSITYRWDIQISNHSNLEAFAQKINFSLHRKIEKLKELLEYPVQRHFIKGTNLNEILKICYELKKKNDKITTKTIAERLHTTDLAYLSQLTSAMVKKNMLKIAKPQTWNGFGSEPREFDLFE